jgi:sorbitol-specific phosphotransferase system component IIA
MAAEVKDENSITEILQHQISWFLREDDAPDELDECSIEHIEKSIKEGYNQGELCVLGNDGDTEYRGWWSIKRD